MSVQAVMNRQLHAPTSARPHVLAVDDDPVIREAITELPREEAELVRRHYLEGARFDHVAEELGLSKSWASRLHTRALTRLSKRLRGLSDEAR